MNSREDILKRIRENVHERYDMPEINVKGIQFADPVEQFINACKTISGATVSFDTPPSDDQRGETSTVPAAPSRSSHVKSADRERSADQRTSAGGNGRRSGETFSHPTVTDSNSTANRMPISVILPKATPGG